MKIVLVGASGTIERASMGQDASAGMPARQCAAAYVAAVEGRQTGQVLDARTFKS